MRRLHFQPYMGISGDMAIASLIDIGLSKDDIEKALSNILMKPVKMNVMKKQKCGIMATTVDFREKEEKIDIDNMLKLVEKSGLDNGIRLNALRALNLIIEAEEAIHGEKPHLHELGTYDTLFDILGFFIGIDILKIDTLTSEPPAMGYGTVETAHGTLPIPAPATAHILSGMQVYGGDVKGELTTPTGAAILASSFTITTSTPQMRITSIGYGAGTRDYDIAPNILRAIIGDDVCEDERFEYDTVLEIKTNIDDMKPSQVPKVIEDLFRAGALDVWTTLIGMKKGRQGIQISVLIPVGYESRVAEILTKETTTTGVRFSTLNRIKVPREEIELETKFGIIRAKRIKLPDSTLRYSIEQESIENIAKTTGLPQWKIEKELLKEIEYKKQ